MVRTIIEAYPKEKKEAMKDGSYILNISECFTETIQGENFVGYPATFLRMQNCTLNCVWCDTKEVWRVGNPYSVNELLDLWYKTGVVNNLLKGQHLVLTGGSPLKQQEGLCKLIETFILRYNVKPFIEVENECVLMPNEKMLAYVDIWNNSPKLANSNMPLKARYNPQILEKMSYENSYFKFVVQTEEDWNEIDRDFIKPGLVRLEQIVLMPEGMTRDELQQHYQIVIDLACKYNVRCTDRFHITIWNKKTGV